MPRAAKRPRPSPSSSPHAQTQSPAPPLLVFAHGAGAPSSSEWMIRWRELLASATNAVEVAVFDYPYFSGGQKKSPPKAEKLVDFHLEQIKKNLSIYSHHPLVLVGKSMGSRVGCMVAGSKDTKPVAIVCLGYPLKGANGAIRDEVLLKLSVPVMFVQGTKDALCPLDKLEAVRKKMSAPTELHVVKGGDHSLKVAKGVLKQQGISQSEVEQQAVTAVRDFLAKWV